MTTPAKEAMSMMRAALIAAPLAVAALMPTPAQAQNFMENIGRNIGYNIGGAATVNNPNPYSRDVISTITGEVAASMGRGVDEQRARQREDEELERAVKTQIKYELMLKKAAQENGLSYEEMSKRGVSFGQGQFGAGSTQALNSLNQQSQMMLQQLRRNSMMR